MSSVVLAGSDARGLTVARSRLPATCLCVNAYADVCRAGRRVASPSPSLELVLRVPGESLVAVPRESDLPPWIYAFYFAKLLPTAFSIYGSFKDPFVAFVRRTPKNPDASKPLGLAAVLTQLVQSFAAPPCTHVVEESDLLFVCVSLSFARDYASSADPAMHVQTRQRIINWRNGFLGRAITVVKEGHAVTQRCPALATRVGTPRICPLLHVLMGPRRRGREHHDAVAPRGLAHEQAARVPRDLPAVYSDAMTGKVVNVASAVGSEAGADPFECPLVFLAAPEI